MSIDGVLDNKKHGGAHELTHEIGSSDDSRDLYVLVSDTSSQKQSNSEADCVKFQDGGHKGNDSDENGYIPENLQFLSDDLDKYEQAVVENNTEWLKARCSRTIDPVEFDMVTQSSANLELLGIMDENVLTSNPVTMSELSLSVTPNNNGLVSDNQKLQSQTANMTVASSNSHITTMTGGNLEQMPSIIPSSIEADLSRYSSTDIQLDGMLLNTDKEKDLELESLNPVTVNNTLKDTVISDFQSALADNLMLGDLNRVSNMKVVMKDGVLNLIPNAEEYAANAIAESDRTETSLLKTPASFIQTGSISTDPSSIMVEPVVQTLTKDAISINSSDTSLPNPQLLIPSISRTENLALATISISNDKLANSTKILVDTNQGRQLYQLNMSDLTGLLNNSGTGTVVGDDQPEISAALVSPVKGDEINGSQTVPGYLLLSVTNKDAEESAAILNNSTNSQVLSPNQGIQRQKNEPMYMCTFEGCGKLFRALSKLKVHNMTHTGERPFKCQEEGCDWAFTKAYKLKRHEESHRGSKNHICDICNKRFTTIYNLNSHMKGHSRPCTEECPVESCNLKFQTRRDLDKHLKTHEGIEKTYKCPYEGCNKLFLSPHCLGSHPRVHMADPIDLTCQFEGCGRKFDKLCRLKQHQRVHTGERPYPCHFEGCNWAFSSASKLTRHMTKHTNKRKWICNECGKAFMRAEHLKGHMITHSGIKPFECPVLGCGQKFVAKSSVYVHMKKHDSLDKDITYHCPMEACERKYTNKAKLRQHIVKHFPGTIKPEDAAQLDIVPLFKNDLEKDKETVVQTSAVTVKTDEDGTMKIDPVEFIATTVDKDGDVSSTVSTQFTAELTAELSSIYGSNDSRKSVSQPSPSPPKISFRKDGNESFGSARTDYHSNKVLSDRAKRRRKLLREKAEGSSSSEDPLEQKNSSVEETSQLSVADALCSQGITFRDPATGVLYVQMQLLQDDPPHPDLYSDEAILTSDISPLPQSSNTDIQCHNVQPAEFVGSTINLQDLVG